MAIQFGGPELDRRSPPRITVIPYAFQRVSTSVSRSYPAPPRPRGQREARAPRDREPQPARSHHAQDVAVGERQPASPSSQANNVQHAVRALSYGRGSPLRGSRHATAPNLADARGSRGSSAPHMTRSPTRADPRRSPRRRRIPRSRTCRARGAAGCKERPQTRPPQLRRDRAPRALARLHQP